MSLEQLSPRIEITPTIDVQRWTVALEITCDCAFDGVIAIYKFSVTAESRIFYSGAINLRPGFTTSLRLQSSFGKFAVQIMRYADGEPLVRKDFNNPGPPKLWVDISERSDKTKYLKITNMAGTPLSGAGVIRFISERDKEELAQIAFDVVGSLKSYMEIPLPDIPSRIKWVKVIIEIIDPQFRQERRLRVN